MSVEVKVVNDNEFNPDQIFSQVEPSQSEPEPIQPNKPELKEAKTQIQFPETSLKINIGKSGGFVHLGFSHPIMNLRLTKKQAREFAARLNKEAI